MYEVEADHRGLVEDTRGLVDTLADMLSASNAEPFWPLKGELHSFHGDTPE